MRVSRWIIVGMGILASIFTVIGVVLHKRSVEHARLLSYGPLILTPLETDLSAETVFPASHGSGNAAAYYVEALNSYTARRPTTKPKKPGVFPPDPPISSSELRLVLLGAEQRECDFYEQSAGRPRFVFYTFPKRTEWPFRYVTNPYDQRPYISSLRQLAQVGLNEGLRRERKRLTDDAEKIYQAVARLGRHLRHSPGSLMDFDLGLEIERKGLHYLDSLYRKQRRDAKLSACWKYGDSLLRLSALARRKFSQLGQIALAKKVLAGDHSRLWRIEAAISLRFSIFFDQPGSGEEQRIYEVLSAARKDPDPIVRAAVAEIMAIPEKEFRSAADEGSGEESP